jgi:hypothetical protein
VLLFSGRTGLAEGDVADFLTFLLIFIFIFIFRQRLEKRKVLRLLDLGSLEVGLGLG